MLKKAGIIVAATAASMVALSPLAFAGEGHHGHGHGDQNTESLVSGVSGNNTSVPINVCGNDTQVGLVPVQNVDPNVPVDLTAGLLGAGGSHQDSDASDTQACGQSGDSGN